MSKLKIAVIGCGGIANQKHFPALKNNADLGEIVSFCDIRIERAAEAAKEQGPCKADTRKEKPRIGVHLPISQTTSSEPQGISELVV